MKIALVYDMIYPFNVGGAELRNYEIAKRLAEHHEVHLFGVKLWSGPDVIILDNIIIHGVCYYSDKYKFSGSRTVLESLRFGLKLFRPLVGEKFDIIDVSAFSYLHCFTASLVAKLRGTPIVFTWHQYWGTYWQEYLGGFKGRIGSKIETLVKYLGQNHVAVSESTKIDLITDGIKAENIFVNYGGVDLDQVKKIPDQAKIYDLIFVGRLTHQKNIQLLIESVNLLKVTRPNLKVCLVGEGLEKKELESLVLKHQLTSNIIFKGLIIDRAEIFMELKKAKVFVLPSLLEGFGIVVVEANSCGLPAIVIKNKWNAAQELIDVGQNGLISGNSPLELSHNILRLITDNYLQQQMSLAALKKAAHFDWDIMVKNLEAYYLKVIENENSAKN